jgi:hypothetical protein
LVAAAPLRSDAAGATGGLLSKGPIFMMISC